MTYRPVKGTQPYAYFVGVLWMKNTGQSCKRRMERLGLCASRIHQLEQKAHRIERGYMKADLHLLPILTELCRSFDKEGTTSA